MIDDLKTLLPEMMDRHIEESLKSYREYRAKGPQGSSAMVWYKALERAGGFRMPRTLLVECDPATLAPLMEFKEPTEFPYEALKKACEEIGYPVFLRTDQASAKHDGPKAYKANGPDDLWPCICRTYEDNSMKELTAYMWCFMVREFLELNSSFVAFGGLPIAREWRIFADQDAAREAYFYWPKAAIWGTELPEDWEQRLEKLSEPPAELEELQAEALRAARAIGHDAWSVDFAQAKDGTWYLIDMALAHQSWRPGKK